MAAAIIVDGREVQIALGQFKAEISDRYLLLRICGEVMRTSIARTFREQGSPAGSWPELAASTRKKKGYGAGHKLEILSGRLFGSFTYIVAGGVLIIGTDVIYARVQQEGSAGYLGGAAGPLREEHMLSIGAYSGLRRQAFKQYGKTRRTGKDGKDRTVRVRAQGPQNATRVAVEGHRRRQNLPPRPFLVFRPEDPERMTMGIEAYLRGKAVKVGKVGSA